MFCDTGKYVDIRHLTYYTKQNDNPEYISQENERINNFCDRLHEITCIAGEFFKSIKPSCETNFGIHIKMKKLHKILEDEIKHQHYRYDQQNEAYNDIYTISCCVKIFIVNLFQLSCIVKTSYYGTDIYNYLEPQINHMYSTLIKNITERLDIINMIIERYKLYEIIETIIQHNELFNIQMINFYPLDGEDFIQYVENNYADIEKLHDYAEERKNHEDFLDSMNYTDTIYDDFSNFLEHEHYSM